MNVLNFFNNIQKNYNQLLYEQSKDEKSTPKDSPPPQPSTNPAMTGEMDPAADPSMMTGGMDPMMGGMQPAEEGPYDEKNPYGPMPPATPKNLGRLFELNKIYYDLKTLDLFLIKLPDVELIKLKKILKEALEIFKIIISNLETYVNKNMIDQIIISYYKFIQRLMYIIQKFYKEKKHDDNFSTKPDKSYFSDELKNLDLNNPFQEVKGGK